MKNIPHIKIATLIPFKMYPLLINPGVLTHRQDLMPKIIRSNNKIRTWLINIIKQIIILWT